MLYLNCLKKKFYRSFLRMFLSLKLYRQSLFGLRDFLDDQNDTCKLNIQVVAVLFSYDLIRVIL